MGHGSAKIREKTPWQKSANCNVKSIGALRLETYPAEPFGESSFAVQFARHAANHEHALSRRARAAAGSVNRVKGSWFSSRATSAPRRCRWRARCGKDADRRSPPATATIISVSRSDICAGLALRYACLGDERPTLLWSVIFDSSGLSCEKAACFRSPGVLFVAGRAFSDRPPRRVTAGLAALSRRAARELQAPSSRARKLRTAASLHAHVRGLSRHKVRLQGLPRLASPTRIPSSASEFPAYAIIEGRRARACPRGAEQRWPANASDVIAS